MIKRGEVLETERAELEIKLLKSVCFIHNGMDFVARIVYNYMLFI